MSMNDNERISVQTLLSATHLESLSRLLLKNCLSFEAPNPVNRQNHKPADLISNQLLKKLVVQTDSW